MDSSPVFASLKKNGLTLIKIGISDFLSQRLGIAAFAWRSLGLIEVPGFRQTPGPLVSDNGPACHLNALLSVAILKAFDSAKERKCSFYFLNDIILVPFCFSFTGKSLFSKA